MNKKLRHSSLYHHNVILYCLLELFRRANRRIRGNVDDISARIDASFDADLEVIFAQIGSNDGGHGDPIAEIIKQRPRWRGIFVEPVPYALEKLKINYGNEDRFIFENVAISTAHETRPFYYVSRDAETDLNGNLPPWYDQLGSFNPDHISNHLNGILEPYKVVTEINCMPLSALFSRHQVNRLDLLHIDTEGFDFEVLKQLDLQKFSPKIILYEHKHLGLKDRLAAENILHKAGYQLTVYHADTLAILTS